MNGEITSIQLGKPMKWSEFKAMPREHQVAYINNLVAKYGVGSTALAEMFGITGTTCSKYLKGDISLKLPTYAHAKQRAKFMSEFCKPQGAAEPDNGQASEEPPIKKQPPAAPKTKAMMLTKTTLSFTGEYNAKLIADKLAALFDDGVNVTVTIDIQMTE